jgi:hypothetical protein
MNDLAKTGTGHDKRHVDETQWLITAGSRLSYGAPKTSLGAMSQNETSNDNKSVRIGFWYLRPRKPVSKTSWISFLGEYCVKNSTS